MQTRGDILGYIIQVYCIQKQNKNISYEIGMRFKRQITHFSQSDWNCDTLCDIING